MKKLYFTPLMLIAAMLLVACSSQDTGTLVVKLTDAPSVQLEKAEVTISEVQVHTADENETDNESDAGWTTVVSGPQTYDLLTLTDATVVLGDAVLPAGKYTQIRLSVESASIVVNGTTHTLTVPSGNIKLVRPFTIVENSTTTLVLDFDAQESVRETGNGKYLLQPVITVTQE